MANNEYSLNNEIGGFDTRDTESRLVSLKNTFQDVVSSFRTGSQALSQVLKRNFSGATRAMNDVLDTIEKTDAALEKLDKKSVNLQIKANNLDAAKKKAESLENKLKKLEQENASGNGTTATVMEAMNLREEARAARREFEELGGDSGIMNVSAQIERTTAEIARMRDELIELKQTYNSLADENIGVTRHSMGLGTDDRFAVPENKDISSVEKQSEAFEQVTESAEKAVEAVKEESDAVGEVNEVQENTNDSYSDNAADRLKEATYQYGNALNELIKAKKALSALEDDESKELVAAYNRYQKAVAERQAIEQKSQRALGVGEYHAVREQERGAFEALNDKGGIGAYKAFEEKHAKLEAIIREKAEDLGAAKADYEEIKKELLAEQEQAKQNEVVPEDPLVRRAQSAELLKQQLADARGELESLIIKESEFGATTEIEKEKLAVEKQIAAIKKELAALDAKDTGTKDKTPVRGKPEAKAEDPNWFAQRTAALKETMAQVGNGMYAVGGNAGKMGSELLHSVRTINLLNEAFKTTGGTTGVIAGVLINIAMKFKGFAQSAANAAGSIARIGWEKIKSGASMAGNAIAGVVTRMKSMAVSIASAGWEKLRSGAAGAANALHGLAQRGFNAAQKAGSAFISKLREIGSRLTSTGKGGNALVKSLTSIKRLLKTRIKRMFISSIFSAVKQDIQTLAKADKEFNASMTSIKRSAGELGGNLAVSFGNLVKAIEPALTTFISAISKAIEYLNAFFALLQGKTVVKAAHNTDDYAKSLKDAGGAAGGLKRQLYSFDELNKVQSDSGSGGAGTTYKDEEIENVLPEKVKAVMDALIAAVQNEKWRRVGEILGESVNTIIPTLEQWIEKFRAFGVKWAANIAEILNGLVDKLDWSGLGNTLGLGISSVLDIADTFLTSFDWSAWGEAIADGISGVIGGIDWGLLCKTLADYVTAMFDTVFGFVMKFDWDALGQGVITGIGAFIQGIDWKDLGERFGAGLNTIVDAANRFFENLNIGSWISTIGEGVNSAIGSIDFESIGELFANGVNTISEALRTWHETINFNEIGAGIGDGLTSALDNIDWDGLGRTFGAWLDNLFVTAYNFVTTFDWGGASAKMTKGLNSFVSRINWELVGATLVGAFNGMLTSGYNFAANFDFGSLATSVTTSIKTFINNIDWTMLGTMLTTWINGLITFFNKLGTGIDHKSLAEKVTGTLKTVIRKIDWTTLTQTITTKTNNLIEGFNTLATSGTMTSLAENVGTLINNVTSSINWGDLVYGVLSGISDIAEAFATILSSIDFGTIATGLADGVNKFFAADEEGNSPFTKITSKVAEFVKNVGAGLGAIVDPNTGINFGQITGEISEGINGFIKDSDIASLVESAGRLVTDVVAEIIKLPGQIDFNGIATEIATGLSNIFKNEKGEVDREKFKNIGESISDGLKNILNSISTFFAETDWDAIGKSIGTALGEIDWLGIAGNIITLLWNALMAAVATTGGLLGKFISGILGLEIVESFDGESSVWASEMSETFTNRLTTGMMNQQQKIASVAAMMGAGFQLGLNGLDFGEYAYQTGKHWIGELFAGLANWDTGEILSAMGNLGLDISYAYAENLAEQVYSMDSATQDALGEALYSATSNEELLTILADFGLDIGDAYVKRVESYEEPASEAGKRLILALQDAKTLDDAMKAFEDAGITISEKFASAITGTGMDNISAALMLLGYGVDDATITALDTSHLSENLSAYMSESGLSIQEVALALMASTGADISQLASDLGVDVGENLGGIIPEAVAEALGKGKKAVEEATQEVADAGKTTAEQKTEMETSGKEAGSKTTSGVESAMSEGKEDVVETATEVKDATAEAFNSLPDDVKPYAESMLNYMVTALSDGNPTVVEAVDGVAKAIVAKAEEILSGDKGQEIINTFLTGMADKFTAVTKDETVTKDMGTFASFVVTSIKEMLSHDEGTFAISDFVAGVADAFLQDTSIYYAMWDATVNARSAAETVFSYNNGFTIGDNLIVGMANGTWEHAQNLVDGIRQIARAAYNAAKDELGIASPSKVFQQIGAYTMQGMQVGLKNEEGNVLNTIGNIASAITDEADIDGAINFSAVNSGFNVMADRLSDIAQTFVTISDILSSIGGLQLPDVATGRIVPYQARAGASGATNDLSTTSVVNGLEDAFYNALQRSGGNDKEITFKLYLDGKQIYDSVNKYQRQAERAGGR